MKVALTFVNNTKKSTRQASRELGSLRTSIQHLMHQLHLKPYYTRLLHGLLWDDPDHRLQFCEIMRNLLTEQPDQLLKIAWIDEACFKLSGHVNRHNSV
ncbi:DUF4817 domain-containing protein [Trichonephila inaurata madagascariensis]|uniref:DUF4817 domain-containing protein n=1 Tax=Trichonephila inaurata madagascariensis TaxID=2747483 RepID=A0A8X6YAG0_9ARAC|nr:DUF4817 domain-containing protein [Trichonephila inaurata madagascariensis]